MQRPTVLALDLEGTLISNAYSQIPRPGLRAFLSRCAELTVRIVMFTTVPEPQFRKVALDLESRGEVPIWFPRTEYVTWSGQKKDLTFVPGASPAEVRIVDDDPDRFAVPSQKGSWVEISHFGPPYSGSDTALDTVLAILINLFGASNLS